MDQLLTCLRQQKKSAFKPKRWPERPPAIPTLRFSPLAWLKLQYLCHAGQTEVGAFGICPPDDLLYIQRIETVLQGTTIAAVEFCDSSVADHFDRCADEGIAPERCGRIWIHTHPGSSAAPSFIDEETFARVFGPCDWGVMFILSRTGNTYARLRLNAGPGAAVLLPVSVDWLAWASLVEQAGPDLPDHLRLWRHEYATNVYDLEVFGTRKAIEPIPSDPTVANHLEDYLERLAFGEPGEEVCHDFV